MRKFWTSLVAATAILVAASVPAAGRTVVDRGLVLDENCNPVPGVKVRYSESDTRFPVFPLMVGIHVKHTRRATTGADGTFLIRHKYLNVKFIQR